MEQLQSHIWLTAFSYMGKYLRLSSYIRKPFPIYDFAPAPLWISLNIRKIWYSFLSVNDIFVNCDSVGWNIYYFVSITFWSSEKIRLSCCVFSNIMIATSHVPRTPTCYRHPGVEGLVGWGLLQLWGRLWHLARQAQVSFNFFSGHYNF